jgi:hypothetical protein
VVTIDSLPAPSPANLVIKLDVEGGEMAALRGAVRTISAAPCVIAALEAHPDVVARTGIDPSRCLRLLASIRPFEFMVGETGMPLDADRPLFDQIPPDRVYNIVARSLKARRAVANWDSTYRDPQSGSRPHSGARANWNT